MAGGKERLRAATVHRVRPLGSPPVPPLPQSEANHWFRLVERFRGACRGSRHVALCGSKAVRWEQKPDESDTLKCGMCLGLERKKGLDLPG